MTSTYYKLKELTEEYQCKVCSGDGKLDDAEPGDISFNTWKCSECNGSGMVRMKKYVKNLRKVLEKWCDE